VRLRRPTVRRVVGAIGTAALALAVVATFAPSTLPPVVLRTTRQIERQVEPWIVVLWLSGAVFVYALYRFWRADEGSVERLVNAPSDQEAVADVESVEVDFDPDRPGRAFDYSLARTVAQLEHDPNAEAWQADRVRQNLKTAICAVRTGEDRSWDDAADEVRDGTWTTDRVPAAFLGGSDAPGWTLLERVYGWLYPARAFERRVERVVDEIERQAEADLDVVAGETASDAGAGGDADEDRVVDAATAGEVAS
jgi:hypothetical protein